MKKLCELRIWIFVSILIGVILLMGVNSPEAKKKPKSTEKWQVSVLDDGFCNIFCTQPNLQEGDGVFVRATKEKSKGDIVYRFRLFIYNSEQTQDIKIGFNGLVLAELSDYTPTGVPCVFPVDCCGGAIPCCMECFLNSYVHPYSGVEDDYYYVDLELSVKCDIEKIGQDLPNPHYTSGSLRLKIWNTDDILKTGYEDFHNISCRREFEEYEENILIERSDGNAWTITIDDILYVFEHYFGIFKGKRWENKFPIRTETPFKLITQWSKLD